jgi:hypothetical protein
MYGTEQPTNETGCHGVTLLRRRRQTRLRCCAIHRDLPSPVVQIGTRADRRLGEQTDRWKKQKFSFCFLFEDVWTLISIVNGQKIVLVLKYCIIVLNYMDFLICCQGYSNVQEGPIWRAIHDSENT